jgi:hypothetical protein
VKALEIECLREGEPFASQRSGFVGTVSNCADFSSARRKAVPYKNSVRQKTSLPSIEMLGYFNKVG